MKKLSGLALLLLSCNAFAGLHIMQGDTLAASSATITGAVSVGSLTCTGSPCGSGSGGGGYAVQPATVAFILSQGATVSSMTVSSNTYLSQGTTFYANNRGLATGRIVWQDGTVSTTAVTSGGGSGDALLASTQTWTGQNNWTTPAQSTFTYGLAVGSLTVSGQGNISFTTATVGGNSYQFVGSSAGITVGNMAVWSTSYSIVDGGAPGTGSGNPGGSSGQVQYNNAGSFGGSDTFQFSGTSITVRSSVTVNVMLTGAPATNSSVGLFDIFGSELSGQRLLTIGSQGLQDQVWFPNKLPAQFPNYGAQLGNIQVGAAASLDTIYNFARASGQNSITFYDAAATRNNQVYQTADAGSGPGDFIWKPATVERMRLSEFGALVLKTSMTIQGAGLRVTNAIDASSGTFTVALNLPAGTAPTVDVTGKIAYDTTDGALVVYNGVVTDVIAVATQTVSVTISSGTGWGGLTIPVFRAPTDMAVTVTKIIAESLPTGTTVLYQLNERAFGSVNVAGSDVFSVGYSTANNTGITTTTFADASIAAQSSLVLRTPAAGSSAGNPDAMTFTIYYLRNRE